MIGLKIAVRTIGILFIMFLCMFMYSCGSYTGCSTQTEVWFQEVSPDKKYSIFCEKLKYPPFSNQKIVFSIGKEGCYGGQDMQLLIDNNRKELDKSNYEIKWTAEGAILTFKGLGQSPVSYVIEWEKAFLNFEKEVKYWVD